MLTATWKWSRAPCRQAPCERPDLDRHPQDVTVRESAWTRPAPTRPAGPLYAISDLHMGDGGCRDSFAYGTHEAELMSFLDMVEAVCGRLVICGDLFELWQSNISKVLTKRVWLLDRLDRMKAIYVLGNHDADLRYFLFGEREWLNHQFFRRMTDSFSQVIGGRRFHFTHGHAADPYCAATRLASAASSPSTPGWPKTAMAARCSTSTAP